MHHACMHVIIVPCYQDNYAYLITEEGSGHCVAVDAPEAPPIEAALKEHGLVLDAIWLTHHHFDHVTGVAELAKTRPGLEVIGGRYDMERDRIAGQTRAVGDEERFEYAGHEVRILEVPGHTLGAIAFVVDGDVFTGDTLFLGGCGRVFEGTMEMMSESLARFRELPRETRVFCGHEYTLNNLRFAQTVEPQSEIIEMALKAARAQREAGEFTVPGRLGQELEQNPFLRFDDPAVMGDDTPVQSFTRLRQAKDSF
jgi:hydroxyacylglutathione hydrolase